MGCHKTCSHTTLTHRCALTVQMTDDKDIYRQRRKLYAQANMLSRKFSMCTVPVKVSLFRSICTPLYTGHLWCRYRQESIRRLTVAYNDCMRLLLRVPRSSSASQMFVSVGVPTCPAVLRNLMYKFMCRATESVNDIITVITDPTRSSVRFTSKLWNHWRTCLYVRNWNLGVVHSGFMLLLFILFYFLLVSMFCIVFIVWYGSPWVWNKDWLIDWLVSKVSLSKTLNLAPDEQISFAWFPPTWLYESVFTVVTLKIVIMPFLQ